MDCRFLVSAPAFTERYQRREDAAEEVSIESSLNQKAFALFSLLVHYTGLFNNKKSVSKYS